MHNKAKSGGEPRLKFGGRELVVVGTILLAVFSVYFLSSSNSSPCGGADPAGLPSSPCGGADRSALPVLPTTARNTRVYTVIDASNKVHRAITEDADIRIVGLVGRSEAIVEANEVGRARLAENPRLTVGDAPGKTFKDVPLRAGELTVTPLRTEDLELIERVVKTTGGAVRGRCGIDENPDLRIVATDETISALMALPEARWIENYEMPQYFNYSTARALNVNDVWPASAGDDCGTAGLGLTGAGQLITMCDSGVDTGNLETLHPDLKQNVIGLSVVFSAECTAYDKHKHGTHTAGSIVGTGAMSSTVLKDSTAQTYYAEGDFKGMAYGAKLWAWMGGAKSGSGSFMPDSISQMFRPTNKSSYTDYCSKHGIEASIFSCSLGRIGGGAYGGQSNSIDQFCWDHPDFLPCFAAGNYGGQLTYPAVAKNTIAVGGATASGGAAGTFGPTSDGRMYPDVITAWSVTSCNTSGTGEPLGEGDNYYRGEAGTSMSTPITAGVCALIREWLVRFRGFNETDRRPSSALIKAVLFGGAIKQDVEAFKQGAGRTNLRSSIAPEDGSTVFLADYIPFEEGMTNAFYLTVTDMSRLDVQLVWVDYPGTPNEDKTTPMLVNDLDLLVESLSFPRTLWVGNGGGVDEQFHIMSDHLNNAESIHIKTLPAGRYRILVVGDNVPHPSTEGGAAALYVKGTFDASLIRMRDRIPPAVYFR